MKIVKALSIAASIASATAATGLVAQENNNYPEVDFNEVGLEYVSQKLDYGFGTCTQDGFNVYGSMEFEEGWFARGNVIDVSGNEGCGSTTLSVGGGYHTPFNDTFDMYGTLSFANMSVDQGDGDSGLTLAGGLRGFLREQIEADIALIHSTLGGGGTEINGGLAYYFDPQFAGTVDLGVGADQTTIAVGVQMDF